ncbi:hypothetical protein BDFB_011817, partial [Asbolus verrucosus]
RERWFCLSLFSGGIGENVEGHDVETGNDFVELLVDIQTFSETLIGNFEFIVDRVVYKEVITSPEAGKSSIYEEVVYEGDTNGNLLKILT